MVFVFLSTRVNAVVPWLLVQKFPWTPMAMGMRVVFIVVLITRLVSLGACTSVEFLFPAMIP